MKTLKIYDPSICCSSGVCGPNVNEKLVCSSRYPTTEGLIDWLEIKKEGNMNNSRVIMDDFVKELIAIGASVAAHCQPCLEYHIGQANEMCIPNEAIADAIHIGQMVEKGAASAMRDHIKGLVFSSKNASGCCGPSDSKGGCC